MHILKCNYHVAVAGVPVYQSTCPNGPTLNTECVHVCVCECFIFVVMCESVVTGDWFYMSIKCVKISFAKNDKLFCIGERQCGCSPPVQPVLLRALK